MTHTLHTQMHRRASGKGKSKFAVLYRSSRCRLLLTLLAVCRGQGKIHVAPQNVLRCPQNSVPLATKAVRPNVLDLEGTCLGQMRPMQGTMELAAQTASAKLRVVSEPRSYFGGQTSGGPSSLGVLGGHHRAGVCPAQSQWRSCSAFQLCLILAEKDQGVSFWRFAPLAKNDFTTSPPSPRRLIATNIVKNKDNI